MSAEKRHTTRIEAGFEAYVTCEGKAIPVKTRNLSLKGVLLSGCKECFIGSDCEFNLPLAPGIRIVVDGVIVREDGGEAAMRFTEMDEASFTQLHRLVQLNADHPEHIDDELVDGFGKF